MSGGRSSSILVWFSNPFVYRGVSSLEDCMKALLHLKDQRMLFPINRSPWIRNLLYFLVYEEMHLSSLDSEEKTLHSQNLVLDKVHAQVNTFFSKWFLPPLVIEKSVLTLIAKEFQKSQITDMVCQNKISYWDKDEEARTQLADRLFHDVFHDVKSDTVNSKHVGFPLPHETKGRPKIGMLECLHENCLSPTFPSGTELVVHLIRENCFTPYYHHWHEDYIQRHSASDIYSMEQDTKHKGKWECPVFCCSQEFGTFPELIYHFESLGIAPFWKPGWQPKPHKLPVESHKQIPVPVNFQDKLVLQSHIQIKESSLQIQENMCICCEEEVQEIVFLPCGHRTVCFTCYSKLEKKICLECRAVIEFVFPTF